jgi:hypothetical protein
MNLNAPRHVTNDAITQSCVEVLLTTGGNLVVYATVPKTRPITKNESGTAGARHNREPLDKMPLGIRPRSLSARPLVPMKRVSDDVASAAERGVLSPPRTGHHTDTDDIVRGLRPHGPPDHCTEIDVAGLVRNTFNH